MKVMQNVEIAASQYEPRSMRQCSGFTLLELMLAIAIFAGVLVAIYSSWTAILRSSLVAQNAAAEAQRSRIAVQAMEQAFVGAQMFTANARHYAFISDSKEPMPLLSFVARLPEAFPRGGRFDGQVVRRVNFSVESDSAGRNLLVLRQTPLLFEPDVDEEQNPLVLARDVRLFEVAFWGANSSEWELEWPWTNQLPRLVRFSIGIGGASQTPLDPARVVTRVVAIPAGGLQRGVPVSGAPPVGETPNPPQEEGTP
jgi:type II secretion system protein J